MRELLPVAGLLLGALASGCAYHATGLVHPANVGAVFTEWDGDEHALVLSGDAVWLAALDGHTAEIWGQKAAKHVVVTAFRVHDGLHGLPTWVGLLTTRGVQLGIEDHNTGAWFAIQEDANAQLFPFVGEPVLIEGYQEPDERVRVMYWRPLELEKGVSP